VKLLSEGWLVKDVAQAVGVSRQSVSTWKRLAGKQGARAKALAAKPQHVPQCRLTKPDQTKLVRLLRAGPRKSGFDVDLWTTARIVELVEQEFDVVYHPSHLGRLLHGLGFSCQKPQRRSKEQDSDAMQAWREKEWPRIKKGGSRQS
jgi:transposase